MVKKKTASKSHNLHYVLKAFLSRRTLVMLCLGFAAGLPNLLIFDTLSAWLRDAGSSLEVIGFFSLATLAYSFKFLWAPLVDRTAIPVLTKKLGHRRSWMLAAQSLIILGLWMIAGTNPATHLGLMALFAVFVGFSSATQDIVIDAWRIEVAESDEQGAMAAAYQWGYRVAVITAGAVPLVLAETQGWNFSYAVMAALMGVGMLAVLFAPREKKHELRHLPTRGIKKNPTLEIPELIIRSALFLLGALIIGSGLTGDASLVSKLLSADAGAALKSAWSAKPGGIFLQVGGVLLGGFILFLTTRPLPGFNTRPGAYLDAALGDPLRDFFKRYAKQASLILALICLYRLSDFVLNIMNPFYLDLGFTKLQIAEVRKVFGVAMSLLGVLLGGFAVARLGLLRALVIGAFAGPLSNLIYIWLATQGADMTALFVAIGIDNLASGFAGTCLIAYMSSLTAEGFTATQYALFSSLYSLPGKLVASQSGRVVEGAAQSAESGTCIRGLTQLFTNTPATAYAEAAAKTGVSPAALGAGYVVFFLYSAVLGIVAILLVLRVAQKGRR